MRLPRMTTRQWIDLAAFVVMLCLAILLLKQRRERFARLAQQHTGVPPIVDIVDLAIAPKTERKGLSLWGQQVAAWHAGMARKYQHAARYPWLPVCARP